MVIAFLVCIVSADNMPPALCSPKLYSILTTNTNSYTRATGTNMHIDLFNTMRFTTYEEASLVLERMALYSTARNPFLRLINQSYAIEKFYQTIEDDLKLSFDY